MVNNSVGRVVRISLARLFSTLGFSFFEFAVILSPFILLWVIFYVAKGGKIKNIIAVFLLIFSLYFINLGIGYNAKTPLQKEGKIGNAELLELGEGLLLSVNSYGGEIREKSAVCYSEIRVKELAFSGALMHLRISGLYSFMTSEANVNNILPSFIYYFTSFHEISHVLGYAREGEANLSAYLLLKESGDEYFSFCADLYALYEALNFIKVVDKSEYDRLYFSLSNLAKTEIEKLESCISSYNGWDFLSHISRAYSDSVDSASYTDFLRLLYLHIYKAE